MVDDVILLTVQEDQTVPEGLVTARDVLKITIGVELDEHFLLDRALDFESVSVRHQV